MASSSFYLLACATCAFVLSACLTALARNYALRTQLLDMPNERSAHKAPTPRGGGLGFVIVITAFFLLYGVFVLFSGGESVQIPRITFVCLGIACAMTALIGWLDDRFSLSAAKRLTVHFLSAALAIFPLFHDQSGTIPIVWFGAGIFLIAGLINFYNFMDGIDGIAGVEAVTSALVLAWVAFSFEKEALAASYLVLAAGSAGFLVFNWPPAKIFMGDIGSGFLGLVFGALAAVGIYQFGIRSLVATLIILGVFIVDATYTLFDRALRGKKVWHAHSEHAYQHSARRWGHKPVTVAVLLINLVWLAPLTVLSTRWQGQVFALLAIAYLPLIGATFYLKRPVPSSRLA